MEKIHDNLNMSEESRKVLVADDHLQSLSTLCWILKDKGYTVFPVRSGMECVQMAKAEKPDIILLDVFMPDMNGIQACSILRDDPDTAFIPIICITGRDDQSIKIECLKAGANEFLVKPVDPFELDLRMKNLLSLKTAEEIRKRNEALRNDRALLRQKNQELEEAIISLKRAQSQILQQEKLASIGQLAAGIAHEINNPIGYISSNLSTLRKYTEKLTGFIRLQGELIQSSGSDDALKKVREAERSLKIEHIMDDIGVLIVESLDGTERVKKIVQDLKSFSRSDEGAYKAADINQGIESTLNIVWNELKYKALITKEFGTISSTRCNIGQLNQVFLNLLMNAAQSIEKEGHIAIRTWEENGFIFISVSDTGCGIAPEQVNRIFEPFYTTKEVGMGTGLGLSIAYDIVKKHNGEILVESEIGKGTTFTVRIPVVG